MTIDEAIHELRRLNQPVPRPPRLPTEEEVAAIEQEVNFPFHPDYRQFLLSASDVVYGTLEPAVVTPNSSYRNLIKVAHHGWDRGVPRSLLPICEDNSDYYCMNTRGEVIFWSHNGTTDEKWPDLATWISEVWIGEYQNFLNEVE